MEPGEAVRELGNATFEPTGVSDQNLSTEHFQQQSEVASSVPVKAITLPDGIDRLSDAIDAIEADLT
jgi:hypothetical protein